ncbi:MAG: EAL domain-containing protein [Pirellulaceae bacterium]|nr:EAL domain-containing protein [Pirellulaceae bacterium]
MNMHLAVSAVGLLAVSLSDEAMAGTMLFYPVAILVSSQLFGVRAALAWFIISLLAFLAFSLNSHGFYDLMSTSKLDELLLVTGVAGCIYFCCQQGEEYYRQRTTSLIKLSENLKVESDRLMELANTDSLTGLANRFRFHLSLKEAVEAAQAKSRGFALFMIDMDGFKEINDTLGHLVGDQTLVEIGTRLQAEFGQCATVARLGGDEFCIIYPNVREESEADLIAKSVCTVLTQRYHLTDDNFQLGTSVGYSLFPAHATSDMELLAFADTAMFHAKENQLGFSIYQREMTDRLVEYRTVQEKLSRALEKDEFFLVYQPQVDLESGEVFGVEALLRWRHNAEVIPPFRFIHILEKNREIVPVSKWIIREACRQLAAWNSEGYDIEISINVSAVQFADPDFCDSIAEPIREFDVDASKLDFEITEGLLIEDVKSTTFKLRQLKMLGASISVDDFGTGYSSLAYLRQFPIDRLKIDRAFIKDIPETDDGVIASSIIVLAKSLDLKVIAEGVETEDHLRFLKSHDCGQYQGYYLSPPVSPEEVRQFFPAPRLQLATISA